MANKTAMIRARVEPGLKHDAEEVFKLLGINPTEAITMFYTQVVLKKRVPFSIDLESGDVPENYITVESDEHLKSLIDLQ